MSLLPDWRIRRDVKIEPFAEEAKRNGKISYGLSSYGYDIRVGYKFKIFTPTNCAVVDPKNFDPKSFVDVDITPKHELIYQGDDWVEQSKFAPWMCPLCGTHKWDQDGSLRRKNGYSYAEGEDPNFCTGVPDHILIPPNSFCLSEALEYIEVPKNMIGLVTCKSTLARCGIVCPSCVLEPSWRGKLTLEVSNCTPLPAKLYAGHGLCQILFFESSEDCEKTYETRQGKYQNQQGLVLPFVV